MYRDYDPFQALELDDTHRECSFPGSTVMDTSRSPSPPYDFFFPPENHSSSFQQVEVDRKISQIVNQFQHKDDLMRMDDTHISTHWNEPNDPFHPQTTVPHGPAFVDCPMQSSQPFYEVPPQFNPPQQRPHPPPPPPAPAPQSQAFYEHYSAPVYPNQCSSSTYYQNQTPVAQQPAQQYTCMQHCSHPPQPTLVTTAPSDETNTSKQRLIELLLELSPKHIDHLRKTSKRLRIKEEPSSSGFKPGSVADSRKNSTSKSFRGSVESQPESASPPLVSPNAQSSTSGDWRDESDTEDYAPVRKGPKTERRTAHNLIEKKYRCSINDRINQLKEMLAPEEGKLSKSATLRRAIEEIGGLRSQNQALITENEKLCKAVCALTSNSPDSAEAIISQIRSSSNTHKGSKKAMVDTSRVTLCVFMLAILAFNPLSLFVSSSLPPPIDTEPSNFLVARAGHRTLQGIEDTVSDEWFADGSWTKNLFVWIFKTVIIVFLLQKLLVIGEPVADAEDSAWKKFYEAKRSATKSINAKNYTEGHRSLLEALQCLNRPKPPARGEITNFVWQVFRHILNSVWIGRFFSRWSRSANQPAPIVCRSYAAAALVYHQLHELHLAGVGSKPGDFLSGLNLALCAVNLAESAGISKDGISYKQRADIYISAAINMKLALSPFLGSLMFHYFIGRSRRHIKRAKNIDGDNVSLLELVASKKHQFKQFMADRKQIERALKMNHSETMFPFFEDSVSAKPIDRIYFAFKLELFKDLCSKLVNSTPRQSGFFDFVATSQLLLSLCTEQSPKTKSHASDWNDICTIRGDELCTWWTHLTTCGLYWQCDMNSHAQKHYELVRRCPVSLKRNPVALSMGFIFCARKLCIDNGGPKDYGVTAKNHVQFSIEQLKLLSKPIFGHDSSTVTAFTNMYENIICQWILSTTVDLWYADLNDSEPYWTQNAPLHLRQQYFDILNRLQKNSHKTQNNKISAMKFFGKIISGSNPATATTNLTELGFSTPNSKSNTHPTPELTNYVPLAKRIQKDVMSYLP